MQTAHELFIHELGDMLDAEKKLVEALGEQEEMSNRPELKKAFASHKAQTEKQVERLEQVFESIGESPEEAECAGIKGLIEEVHNFMEEEDPSEDLIDVFNIGAATKVENYEIVAYESLIRLATDLGHKKAIQLLSPNLREEEETLKKLDGFANKIRPEQSGMDEEIEVDAGGEQETRKPASGGKRSRRVA